VTYYIWYILALVQNCKGLWKRKDPVGKLFLTYSQVIHVVVVGGGLAGVFIKTFPDGADQIFFQGLVNIYVYSLTYFYWPVKTDSNEFKAREQKQEDEAEPEQKMGQLDDEMGKKVPDIMSVSPQKKRELDAFNAIRKAAGQS